MTPSAYLLGATSGLVGGWVNAVAGGGSLVLYPSLVAIGLPTVDANVTNSVALLPGYAGNVLGLGEQVEANRRVIGRLAAPAIVGAAAGCALLLATPGRAFDFIVPVLVIAASLLLAAQPRLKLMLNSEHVQHPATSLISTVIAAVYGGYFGGGLGVILLAVLGLTLGCGIKVANAVKGALSLLISLVAAIGFALFGPVHWELAMVIAPAALLGGLLGGRFASRVDESVLRRTVVLFGLAVGIWLAIRVAR